MNNFYKKNEFILERKYSTNEGKIMNEYRFYMEKLIMKLLYILNVANKSK